MNQDFITIRPEEPGDKVGIFEVESQAFGRPDEARLVETLRTNGRVTLSLVAVNDGRIVGHVLFSPATIVITGVTTRVDVPAVAIGPVAVASTYQGQGIGSRLIEAGLEACRAAGHQRAIVLGQASYYPRFGFVPASTFGVTSQYDVPDDVFMALALAPEGWAGVSGQARYSPEFTAVD